jgi:16S rRNA (uracil1498-N3)-methyltransferase
MTEAKTTAKVRLYVDQSLGVGQPVTLGEAGANYLFNVMRLGIGAEVKLFNGRDGEWLAAVQHAGKRAGILTGVAQLRPFAPPPDLWLVFAPIKKARLDFVVEKAVELGAARLVPVLTRFTNAERLRPDKMRAHVIEAAEQCEAVHLPDIAEPVTLDRLLATWPAGRQLYWADEALAGHAALLAAPRGAPAAMLIGPEGGFAPEERDRLRALPFVTPFALGPRILRAETAALAALTLWQASAGDWA